MATAFLPFTQTQHSSGFYAYLSQNCSITAWRACGERPGLGTVPILWVQSGVRGNAFQNRELIGCGIQPGCYAGRFGRRHAGIKHPSRHPQHSVGPAAILAPMADTAGVGTRTTTVPPLHPARARVVVLKGSPPNLAPSITKPVAACWAVRLAATINSSKIGSSVSKVSSLGPGSRGR